MAVITIQGLTSAGDVLAVDNLSFEVDQGTVVGFLDRTGPARPPPCACCSAWSPRPPGPLIDGRPYRALEVPVRHVGAVLEASSFIWPWRQQPLRVVAAAGLPLDRADQVLEQVGLANAARRRVGGFSLACVSAWAWPPPCSVTSRC